MELQLTISI